MKLCKDCKWCEPGTERVQVYAFNIMPIPFCDLRPAFNQLSTCNHPLNMKECPVSGKKSRIEDFCTILRGYEPVYQYPCGKKALWFEPRMSVNNHEDEVMSNE